MFGMEIHGMMLGQFKVLRVKLDRLVLRVMLAPLVLLDHRVTLVQLALLGLLVPLAPMALMGLLALLVLMV